MKKINTILLLALSMFVFNNCSDKIDGGTNDINYISFEPKIPTIIVEKDGTASADILAYTTQITGSDRTFDVNVIASLTSANPTSYSVPTSITVPANSNVGTLTVDVADVNLDVDPVTLALQFGTKDGLFTGNSASITIQKHCTLDINDFVGTYSGNTVGENGGPTHVVTSLDANGNLQITGMGVSFLTGYWGEVITSMETLPMDVDLATGDFTITEATYITTTYNGAVQPVYKLSAEGNLNACSGTMYLYYDFYQEGVGSYVEYMGSADNFTEIIKIN
jgi:hypothetical protein